MLVSHNRFLRQQKKGNIVYLIGIAGGSGSGKTTFSNKLSRTTTKLSIISMDSYYLPTTSGIVTTPAGKTNFDHPDAFDWELLRNHIQLLKSGNIIECPVYDFSKNERSKKTINIYPNDVIIIEGIFTLYDSAIRDMLSLKCFLDVPCDIRFIRRLQRDVKERGRDLNSIIEQYYDSVRPMYIKYLDPQKRFSDLVIGSETDIACDVISARIKQVFDTSSKQIDEEAITTSI